MQEILSIFQVKNPGMYRRYRSTPVRSDFWQIQKISKNMLKWKIWFWRIIWKQIL